MHSLPQKQVRVKEEILFKKKKRKDNSKNRRTYKEQYIISNNT